MPPLKVLPKPCDTCPYAKSTPAGVWAASEYEKLPAFDDPLKDPTNPVLSVFRCHNGGALDANETVCRGWLSVHRYSVPVCLALARGKLRPEDIPEMLEAGLYATGAEACKAGLRGVKRPGKKAQTAMQKINRARADKSRWSLRADFSGGHRFFDDKKFPGRIAVADQSGYFPDQTYDGVHWLDAKRPIRDGSLPLINTAGVETWSSASLFEAERVAVEFGLRIAIDEDDDIILGED